MLQSEGVVSGPRPAPEPPAGAAERAATEIAATYRKVAAETLRYQLLRARELHRLREAYGRAAFAGQIAGLREVLSAAEAGLEADLWQLVGGDRRVLDYLHGRMPFDRRMLDVIRGEWGFVRVIGDFEEIVSRSRVFEIDAARLHKALAGSAAREDEK